MYVSNDIRIVHECDESRYDIYVDGTRGGSAEYVRADGVITFIHTFTEPAMRGKGLAGRVVMQALDEARAEGFRVVPQCWYVAQFIECHPEYRDLLS